uniref:exosporium glycoprotein BclB-related protein n=1 Tax=Sporosarcina beigongshangi TaxID=2782538 RepID=UPI001E5F0384|nr:exosporium glycoprotein BclB-related protein [Sporosarcina beigongshangi]
MNTLALGLVGTPALIGFGTSMAGVSIAGGSFTLPALSNLAFMVPRTGTLTSISAFFRSTVGLNLPLSTMTVHAEIYRAIGDSSTFNATGVTVNLAFPSTISIGTAVADTASGFSFNVNAGDRLLMVFSATASGINLVNTLTGEASAGLSIN